MRRAEAEQARHRELIAWFEDPQGYKPGKASKERTETPKAKPSTFSVIGGRPAEREPASPGAGAA